MPLPIVEWPRAAALLVYSYNHSGKISKCDTVNSLESRAKQICV